MCQRGFQSRDTRIQRDEAHRTKCCTLKLCFAFTFKILLSDIYVMICKGLAKGCSFNVKNKPLKSTSFSKTILIFKINVISTLVRVHKCLFVYGGGRRCVCLY